MQSLIAKKILSRVDILCYFISSGVLRAAPLVLMPLFFLVYDDIKYSKYIIAILISKILSRFINLSGTTVILREGAVHRKKLKDILSLYNLYTIFNSFLAIFGCLLIIKLFNVDIFYALIVPLAMSESFVNLRLHYYRAEDMHYKYLLLSMGRFILEVALLGLAYLSFFSLDNYLIYFSVSSILISLPYFNLSSFRQLSSAFRIYAYSLPVIPTTVLGWILNSSDRVIIKFLNSELAVVKYSVAYNMASIVLLVTATLAVWLPSQMFSDYSKWSSKEFKNKFFIVYSLIVFSVSILAYGLYKIDQHFFNFFKYYGNDLDLVFLYSALGCYFTGLVAYTSNLLIYVKKTSVVLWLDACAAFSNVALNFLLIPSVGIKGAAIATLLSFLIQFLLSSFYAKKYSNVEVA